MSSNRLTDHYKANSRGLYQAIDDLKADLERTTQVHLETSANSTFTSTQIDQLGLLRAWCVGLIDPLDFDADDGIDMATNGSNHSSFYITRHHNKLQKCYFRDF